MKPLPTIDVWVGFSQRLPRMTFRGIPRGSLVSVLFGDASISGGCVSAGACMVAKSSGAPWLDIVPTFDPQCGYLEIDLTEEQSIALKGNGVIQVTFTTPEGVLLGEPFSFPMALRRALS